MSNIKKIIGVLLALVMTLSMAAVAFAADGDKYSITITSDKTTLEAGQSATVTVKLTANYNVSAISIPVFFDKSKVTVDAGSTTVEGASIVTEDSESVDSQIYNGSGLSKDQYGVRALVMVPEWGQSIKKYTDETVMTFTVTPVDGASGAVVFECVDASVKTTAKPGGSLYVGKNSSGNDTVDSNAEVIDDYDISKANTTITLGSSSEPADLAIKADYDATGIVIDTNKTFGGQYAGVVYGFNLDETVNAAFYTNRLEATNGGSITVVKTPYVARPASYGTGATIQVKNADGSLVKTYVIVIFGDVNGDGRLLSNDALLVYNHANSVSEPITDEIKIMAANAAPASGRTDSLKAASLHTVNSLDALAIYNAVNGSSLNQGELASSHALYNYYYQ